MARPAKALRPGGTIGVPAPGWAFENRSDILRGLRWWEAKGYRVKLGDSVTSRLPYRSDPSIRARELVDMFADPEVDAVQCYDAGYGIARLIPFIDFDVIAANPKPFVGFSEATALLLAIHRMAGIVCFYGPVFLQVGLPGREVTGERMLASITSTEPLGALPELPGTFVRAIAPGTASGELVGGTLWPICQSVGTPRQPDLRGRILFFEDVRKPPYLVCEQLCQLEQAGALDGVAGVVVGEMVRCDWRYAPEGWPRLMSLEDVLEEHLEGLGVPVIHGIPAGHLENFLTLPVGVQATIDADRGTLSFDGSAVVA